MNIANSVGCYAREPILIIEEYDHWKTKMVNNLKCK